MADNKTGRNDPCPCGSGKKYKHCCIGREETPPESPSDSHDPHGILAEFHKALQSREFASEEELQAFVHDYNLRRNRGPVDNFCGLSPEQMYRFLDFPFDSPQLVTFPSCLDEPPSAPVLTLFGLLAEAIGEKGLKTTAKGNLPRNFLREAALTYWGEEGYEENTRFGGINTEHDFSDMHATRIVAQVGGLVRKYKGRFVLTRDCRKVLTENGPAGIYPRLVRTYAERFNWAYRDRHPEISFIQRSFLFTLYLLHIHGGQWRPNSFYEDAYLRAFPHVVNEVETPSWDTPENMVRHCYSWRCLRNFAAFLGLAEIKETSDDWLRHDFEVRKLPLLDKAVVLHIPA
ncbi:MAG: SEC-C metal-binding domain-containing protein [Armatimonadota bacterium]|nr:SEC-C metal-binding domain-containing protein [Armatimonadota bacterium]